MCLPIRNCSETHLYCAVLHALSNDVQQIGAQAHKRQNDKLLLLLVKAV
jgi:hypothetical protein